MDMAKGWLVFVGMGILLIAAIVIWSVFSLKAQHDIINPQVRQNLVDDPNTSISNVANFKQEITAIETDDTNILTTMNALDQTSKNDPHYSTLTSDLASYEALRITHIGAYNADASNPDKKHDLPPGMPGHLTGAIISGAGSQEEHALQNEVTMLQNISA